MKAEDEMSYSEEEKIEHVRACLKRIQQGRTIRSYVAEHEFSRAAMYDWLKRYRHTVSIDQKEQGSVSMVRVKSMSSRTFSTEQTSSLKVNVGALSIELPSGNSEADLHRVLRALKEVL